MTRKVFTIVALATLTATPAMAQEMEVHAFGGFRSGGGFNIDTEVYERLSIDEGPVFGAGFGYSLNERFQLEFIWSRGVSDLLGTITLGGGEIERLDPVRTDQLHGNVVIDLGEDDKYASYVLVGLGATLFRPENLGTETRFSWDAGLGMKIRLRDNFGIRVQGRAISSNMSQDQEFFCDPATNECLRDSSGSWLFLFEGTGGVFVTF